MCSYIVCLDTYVNAHNQRLHILSFARLWVKAYAASTYMDI